MDEWVEVSARTVDEAVEAALEELGIEERQHADIEVIQEPERRFFGASRDAIVRVKRRPSKPRRRRRRGRGGREQQSKGGEGSRGRTERRPTKDRGGQSGGSRTQDSPTDRQAQQRTSRERSRQRAPRREEPTKQRRHDEAGEREAIEVDIEEQRQVIHDFLEGLVAAFGLDGTVESEIGDDFIAVRIVGEQTEALVGPQGSVLQSILELSRTVVQRKTQAGVRIRLDIAGYAERRREALRIYAGRLAERVIEDGGEIMLEPMNAADRKAVHDVIAETDGVRSFSEGEEPNRSVVIGPDDTA